MANKMERFTQRARHAMFLAQDEAERMQHATIGTEHLLLGLLREESGIASQLLREIGIQYERTLELVGGMTTAERRTKIQQLDLSVETKQVLELAIKEARRLGHRFVDTRHLLLGLAGQSEGGAVDVLKQLRVSSDELRRHTKAAMMTFSLKRHTVKNTSAESSHKERVENDILASLRSIVPMSLLPKLLTKLAQSASDGIESEISVKELFGEVLREQSIVLNEEIQTRLLALLHEPFNPVKPIPPIPVRVHITDKATGQVIVDMRLVLEPWVGLLGNFADFFYSESKGKSLVVHDDEWHIELSTEDSGKAAI